MCVDHHHGDVRHPAAVLLYLYCKKSRCASCCTAALCFGKWRAFPTIATQNKKAIAFAFLHQRWLRIGAADEARTRYLHLGKVALYQMSYGRISGAFIPAPSRAILANFGAPAKACEARFCGEKEKVLHDFRCGASDRNRTNDTGIFSPLLYRLSYRGKYDPDRARTDDPQRDRLVL